MGGFGFEGGHPCDGIEASAMDQRREFVRLALHEGVRRCKLCRRCGISPETGSNKRLAGLQGATGRWRIVPAPARQPGG